jgi:hypothetical protein
LALSPGNAEALELKGIACSSLGLNNEATTSFRAAVAGNPNVAKPAFNLAVHLNGVGDKAGALEAAMSAATLEPTHSAAVELMRSLEAETGASPMELPSPPEPNPDEEPVEAPDVVLPATESPYLRAGYYGEGLNIQSLRFVEQLGHAWYWIAAVFILVTCVLSIAQIVLFYKLHFAGGPNNPIGFDPANPVAATGIDNLQASLSLVFYFFLLALLIWFVLEIVNRRTNYLWLVAFLASCCVGMTWLVVLLYLIFERPRVSKPT